MKHKLKVGDQAPLFQIKDVFGNKTSLAKNQPGAVLVVFLRYSGCPWCNLAIHRLAVESELLKKQKCSIVAFIQSSPENVLENIYKRHERRPPFPVIADQAREIYDKYGVTDSITAAGRSITEIPYWLHSVRKHGYKQTTLDGSLFLVPAMFLVSGRSGKILMASYGKSFYDHDTFTRVYEKLGFAD